GSSIPTPRRRRQGTKRDLPARRRKHIGRLTARDDLDDLQAVAGGELPLRELGRRDGLAIVLDDDAAREQALRDEERLDGAGERRRGGLAVGDDAGGRTHV